MDVLGIIPARFDSTRLAGKVLADICGKPMIQHVWERAKKAKLLDDIIIATDDNQVLKAAKKFGAKAVLTAKGHLSGTDRLTEIVNPIDVKIIVNIQGDEPLIHPMMINELALSLLNEPNASMSTLKKKIENEEELNNPNVVKVVTDRRGFAVYFSRCVIPYRREGSCGYQYYKHIGLYAYTKDFLFTFTNLPVSKLELTEKLEQLRAIENGYKIKVIETKYETVGVDTPEDLEKVKRIIESEGSKSK